MGGDADHRHRALWLYVADRVVARTQADVGKQESHRFKSNQAVKSVTRCPGSTKAEQKHKSLVLELQIAMTGLQIYHTAAE